MDDPDTKAGDTVEDKKSTTPNTDAGEPETKNIKDEGDTLGANFA